jgi:hypothetical protein
MTRSRTFQFTANRSKDACLENNGQHTRQIPSADLTPMRKSPGMKTGSWGIVWTEVGAQKSVRPSRCFGATRAGHRRSDFRPQASDLSPLGLGTPKLPRCRSIPTLATGYALPVRGGVRGSSQKRKFLHYNRICHNSCPIVPNRRWGGIAESCPKHAVEPKCLKGRGMNGKGMQFIPLTDIPLPQKFFGDSTAPHANKTFLLMNLL